LAEEKHGAPSPADLLKAALEKIVFFEWRASELAAELAAAQSRAASAERERSAAEQIARAAQEQAQAARLHAAELESERARLAALLARPMPAAGPDASLDAERGRSAQLAAELAAARAEVERHRAERERWLGQMIEQARAGDEAPAALAEFIAELRGEVLALRERLKGAPPPQASPPPAPRREPGPVEAARAFLAEGRIGGPAAALELERLKTSDGAAAALAAQCARGLESGDPTRRAQAALHLAAVPVASAAPLLARALGGETDARARAAMARALVACGGETAAQMAAALLDASEPPLVRMAALEALAALGGERGRAALEAGSRDPSPAVRRRTAALLLSSDDDVLRARLAADEDVSVRATCSPREAPEPPRPAARDLDAEALQACRAAMFGLTEDELGDALGVGAQAAGTLAARLVAGGALAMRGKRLVAPRGEERR